MSLKTYLPGLVFTLLLLSACATPPTETQTPAPPANIQPSEIPTQTVTPIPQATPTFAPLFEIGQAADLANTDDFLSIEGRFEYISLTEIEVTGFFFDIPEAPGVDIRLGVDRDFSDAVAVSLRDITGKKYAGGDFTLSLPAEAFDGRIFNSIAIYCYDTGDIFDFIVFESPAAP